MKPLQLDNTPGRTAFINNKEYLFFSGFNYLGINQVPEFKELVKEGIDKYGMLFPSSRISNTQLKLFEEFEALLSNIGDSFAAACFSSGYLAGKAATSLFEKELLNAPGSHPAILRNNNLLHDFKKWSDIIVEQINTSNRKVHVVAADAVNVLTGIINDFSFLKNISKPVTVIVDDSHGAGIIGAAGKGISSFLPRQKNIEYIINYSLSKAYGINGGAVSCSKKIYQQLITTTEYTAATSLSPALVFAFIKGQHIYALQLQQLRSNIGYFKNLFQYLPVENHNELPIFILPATIDYEKLLQQNIIISSFGYPDANAEKINRVVINALHTKDDLEKIAKALREAL